MSKNVYVAGPLFTDGDRWYLENITESIESHNLTTYLPHRDAGLCPSDGRDTEEFFVSDYKHIDGCELVVAILHGTDIDSGTAWEIGYAYAKNKYIIAIADDIRIANEITNINLMISNSSIVCFSIDEFNKQMDNYMKKRIVENI